VAKVWERKNKTGSTWKVSWRLGGGRDGSWQSLTVASSKADADDVAALAKRHGHRLTADQIRELIDPTPQTSITATDWCKRFVTSLTGIEPATRGEYERIIDQHIAGRPLGRIALADVTREHVRLWVRSQEGTLSPKSISNHHSVLSAALGEAAALGKLPTNPCRGVRLPRRDDHTVAEEHCYLTPSEVGLICGELERFAPWCADIPWLLARTGLRWSELTALQVGDVDLMGSPATLTVARSWKRQADGSYAVGAPKTKRSRRTISIDAATVNLLASRVAGRAASAWLVPGPDGRSRLPRTTFARHWSTVLNGPRPKPGETREPAGLVGAGMLEKAPRVHDLRHTHASWLLDDPTVSMYRVQRRMGHESITTTEGVYGHLRADGDVAILAALDAVTAAGPIAATESVGVV
jgi:integrase